MVNWLSHRLELGERAAVRRAGSGYLDQGDLFDFTPTDVSWLTGGTVGPEGSVFAFIAVLCAFGLLAASTARQGIEDRQR